MRIGIITLNGFVNIGNRLQNYAVQELLKERGHDVETIFYAESSEKANRSYKIKSLIINLLIKYRIYSSYVFAKIKKDEKMALGIEFNNKYIKSTTKYMFKEKNMKKYVEDFDYYCAGSDQVWNAAYVENKDFFFMCFAEPARTFSFSASMGTSFIPNEYLDNYKKGFSHVGNISVREDSVRDKIKMLTDRDSVVLLDPTLLLPKDRWKAIARKPDIKISKKYVATYFLSEITESQQNVIKEYARKNDCEIIELNDKHNDYVGPLEFLYLIANAEFVFTDSFHGTAFSIIFERKFIVFQRNKMYDMSSRITTILNTFCLSHRFYNKNNLEIDSSFWTLVDKVQKESIEHIKKILDNERKKASGFLDQVFEK